MNARQVGQHIVFYLPVALLAASLTLNVWQYHRSNGRLVAVAPRPPRVIEKGTALAPLSLRTLDGRAFMLDYRDPLPTVIYAVSPACVWCATNSGAIRQLTECVRGRYRVLAISQVETGLEEFLRAAMPNYPVLVGLDSESAKAYGLVGTPETIVVSRDGTVEKVWIGAYSGEVGREVEQFFGCSLTEAK